MTRTWLDAVLDATVGGAVVRAVVIACEGSCPREVGADMLVWPERTEGTIGGGSLEHDAIAAGRNLLLRPETPWVRDVRRYHLGPDLNQCCGGAVTVLLERYGAEEREGLSRLVACGAAGVTRPTAGGIPPRAGENPGSARLFKPHGDGEWFEEPVGTALTPLVIYGAGHVARALVRMLTELPFATTWIDIAEDRFPAVLPAGFRVVVASAAGDMVEAGKAQAIHLVMTHSHELDEAIVAALLKRCDFSYLGMIGSATKAARFRQRLLRAGFEPAEVARLQTPIGLPGLKGKSPAVIAVSVAADLMLRRSQEAIGG